MTGQTRVKTETDSIQELIVLSSNTETDIDTRIEYAKRAVAISKKTGVDSTYLNSKRHLGNIYLESPYHEITLKENIESLRLAEKLKDSSSIGRVCSYLGYFYTDISRSMDSAFYYNNKALKFLRSIKFSKKSHKAKMSEAGALMSLSKFYHVLRDFSTSQYFAIELLKLLEDENNGSSRLYRSMAYNVMGSIMKEIEEFEKALQYYNKALQLVSELDSSFAKSIRNDLKSNISELYRVKGDYSEAIRINQKLLKDSIWLSKNNDFYAIILHNLANAKFLNKRESNDEIDSLFMKARTIFKKEKLFYALSSSGNDLAEYYHGTGRDSLALKYTKESYAEAKKLHENDEVLRALKMFSKLNKGEGGKKYLNKYINLSDSLVLVERANRNKYARIQFETDQYIKRTKDLEARTVWSYLVGGACVLLLSLLYLIKQQKSKNKELVLLSEQEKANQEIYRLMLKRQAEIEEGRIKERHRVAEDLHDGILGSLLGIRLGMGLLKLTKEDKNKEKFEFLNAEMKNIEKEVRSLSHDLKHFEGLAEINFQTLIEEYLEKQSLIGSFDYKASFESPQLLNSLDDAVKVEVYKIIQEAIFNIIKHAKARFVEIDMFLNKDVLKLKIQDDGVGFYMTANLNKGIGLKNIESRVKRFSGSFKIESEINQGTKLNIIIPLKN